MPHDRPNRSTVYSSFRQWTDDGTWEAITDALRAHVRLDAGKDADPSVGIIDSHSVKVTAIPGERGFDGGKLVNGRKRSVIVDTLGMLLRVVVHPADLSDLVGGKWVAERVAGVSSRLTKLFGDRHSGGQFTEAMQTDYGWEVEVIRRPPNATGFQVLPKRWIVERTFGWLTWYRRLSKDYEQLVEASASFIYVYVAMIHLMLRRLHPPVTS